MRASLPNIKKSLKMNQGVLSSDGALIVKTGKHTGRSVNERFVVDHPEIHNEVEWGGVNQAISKDWADGFFKKLTAVFNNPQNTESMKGFVGCFQVEIQSTSAWHIAFAQNMFRTEFVSSLKDQVPDDICIQIFHAPDLTTSKLGIEHDYEAAIIVDLLNYRVGIIGTGYAGEIKKSAFSLCNFLLPKYNILPMHSSANTLRDGKNSCILFGLSGTGKTTLSADPNRLLIGDDEIIWSANGLSNLEGGCYAKLIKLSKEREPDIFKAVNQSGSILENVVYNESTKEIDFNSSEITENTRASYSIESLGSVFEQNKEAGVPSSIIFLTADAFGALPAVAKLDKWQAQYHFISGYTAKVAGTEMGVTEPTATFSACFGAPFMPRSPAVYGQLLAKLIEKNNVSVWLLNTGWMSGGYGKSERFPIPVSRKLLSLIQSGEIESVELITHPIFRFKVPVKINGIPDEYLAISEGEAVINLATKFIANSKRCFSSDAKEIIEKGQPQISSSPDLSF